MNVLVIGGTGFIGTKVVRRLAASGEKVICLDIAPGAADFSDVGKDVKMLQGDVTCLDEIIGAIQRYGVESIVHLSVQRRGLHSAMRVSALGTNCVFEAARLTNVKRIVFASSVAYYGPQDCFGQRPVTENDRGFPTITYGVIKWMNEFMAREYNTNYGMEIVALRIALVYGWGHRGGLSWANDMVTRPATGKPVSIPHRSSHKVCLIHVEDIAEIFTRLAREANLDYDVYLTGGDTCTVGEMAGIVKEFIPEAQISFDEQAEELPFAYLIDNSRLRSELGIGLRSLRDGISQVISAVRKELKIEV